MNKQRIESKHIASNSVVLLSGGIDSTACLHYCLDQGLKVRGLYLDYGQLAKHQEESSVNNITSYYGIELDKASFSVIPNATIGEIKGRNAFLILGALLYYPKMTGIIFIGIHSGVSYYDCSERFLKDMMNILDGYTDGRVRIDAPFLEWNKSMIYTYCMDNNVPVHLTYSCEAGTLPPCGKCRSCRDRKVLDAC